MKTGSEMGIEKPWEKVVGKALRAQEARIPRTASESRLKEMNTKEDSNEVWSVLE